MKIVGMSVYQVDLPMKEGSYRVWIGLRADEGADGRGKWAGGPMLN